MPRYAHKKSSAAVKLPYVELIREGLAGAEAARRVGVALSCDSLWFIDAGVMSLLETSPISARSLSRIIGSRSLRGCRSRVSTERSPGTGSQTAVSTLGDQTPRELMQRWERRLTNKHIRFVK